MEYKCTCKRGIGRRGGVIFCPLHKAAPDMYEALKAIKENDMLKLATNFTQCGVLSKIDNALVKVDGK